MILASPNAAVAQSLDEVQARRGDNEQREQHEQREQTSVPPHKIPKACLHCEGAFGVMEGHGSLLSNLAGRTGLNFTFGASMKGGYRFWRGLGGFFQVEFNAWRTTALRDDDDLKFQAVLNVGPGIELLQAQGYFRSSISGGPSILLRETLLDKAGQIGFFVDVRPAGLRWPLWEWGILGVDPISFVLVVPVLKGIPLIQAEYRSVVYTEVMF